MLEINMSIISQLKRVRKLGTKVNKKAEEKKIHMHIFKAQVPRPILFIVLYLALYINIPEKHCYFYHLVYL